MADVSLLLDEIYDERISLVEMFHSKMTGSEIADSDIESQRKFILGLKEALTREMENEINELMDQD